jgi:hypothetical protein
MRSRKEEGEGGDSFLEQEEGLPSKSDLEGG